MPRQVTEVIAGQDYADNEQVDIEADGAEQDDLILNKAEKRSILTQSNDRQIDSLYKKYKHGKLILQPDFQRQFVWDKSKSSRLIESVLIAVPLPVIYLAEEGGGRESVIDGQQRLTSFFDFIDGELSLTGLRVFSELNGKHYIDLSDEQRDRLDEATIRTVTILQDSNPDLKFEIFERLNTGAVPLNDMELRNCIFRGSYMKLLKELSVDPEFTKLVGFVGPDKRMRDIELVLRFASFFHATYIGYQSPMKKFFNREMEMHHDIKEKDANALRKAFKNSLAIVGSLFPNTAFKRYRRGIEDSRDGYWETKKFNASLYDVMMGVFADKDRNMVQANLDSLREAIIDLMADNDDFIESILLGTSDVARVRKRFDLFRDRVDTVLKNQKKQERCFSKELKKELFDKNPTCKICNQSIESLDDAAVDHIEQYWTGGKTIKENARLAHRYCNWTRPRND